MRINPFDLKPPRLHTEERESETAIEELEAELLKPSTGETIALWLDYPDLYSQAFKDKVAEIRKRYTAGEWDGVPTTKPGREAKPSRQPLTAPAPKWEEAETAPSVADLYTEESFLHAMYPPIEELQGRADELEEIEIAEAIDTFLDHATETEKRDFFKLERERIR